MGRGKRWDADMRKAIISMCLHGLQIDQVARLTGASQRTISRVMLERSFHVATQDYEKDVINSRAVEFVRSLTSR